MGGWCATALFVDVALPQEVAAGSSYWFVCPEGAVDRPRVAAFRAWLLEEAARERGG